MSADGYFTCHACHAKGDVIEWVEQRDGIDFNAACQKLAQYAGLEVPRRITVKQRQAEERRRVVRNIGKIVAVWHKALPDELREWLQETYGLTDKTIDHHEIGYADANVEALLEQTGLSIDDAKGTGLIIENEKKEGELFIPLYSRVVFTWKIYGKVCYCSGRRVHGKPARQYDKSWSDAQHIKQTLSRDYVSDRLYQPLWGGDRITHDRGVLIAEGIADAMLARQELGDLEDEWVVVSPTTNRLTDRDADYISKQAPGTNIVICFDHDDKGEQGARDTSLKLAERGFVPRIYTLREADSDLNDYLREGGKLLTVVREAVEFWEPWAEELRQAGAGAETRDVGRVLTAVAKLEPTLKKQALAYIGDFLEVAPSKLEEIIKVGAKEITSGKVGQAIDVILEYYRVVGYNREAGITDLILWSKKRADLVTLPLTKAGSIPGIMAPDCDIIAELAAITEGNPTQRRTLLTEAIYLLATEARPKADFTEIKSGLHCIEDKLIIISGIRILLKEKGKPWIQVDDPFVVEGYLAVASSRDDDWLEWDSQELSQPLKYTPKEVYGLLIEAINTGWRLKQACDYRLLALLPFAYVWATAFPRKALVHIQGGAGCGKTSLTFGLYGGAGDYARMGGPFIPTATCQENMTFAALASRFGGASRALILDEGEISSSSNIKHERNIVEILTGIRNAAESGTGVMRGTAEGGWRESVLNLGCIISSISAWESDQDVRRWLVVQPARDTRPVDEGGVQQPNVTVSRLWQERGVDCKEMRRTVLLAFQDDPAELMRVYEELMFGDLPGDNKISPSQRDNMLPILTIAKILDDEFNMFTRGLLTGKGDYEKIDRSTTVEERLVDTLLNSPFEEKASRRLVNVWGGTLGHYPQGLMAPYGVVVDEIVLGTGDEARGLKVLLVKVGHAQKRGPLKGTEFEHMTARTLIGILRNHSAFEMFGIRRRYGEVNVTWTALNWEKIAGSGVEHTVVDEDFKEGETRGIFNEDDIDT